MGIDDALRWIVREELRSALKEQLPELLGATLSAQRPTGNSNAAYLSTAEAARMAGVRSETIRSWITDGKLPGHRAGRELRIRRDELEAYMAEGPECESPEVDLKQRARDILAGRPIEDG